MSEDLKLVPTEAIMNELLARFDHAIIVIKKINGPTDSTFRKFKGHPDLCAGLCMDMNNEIQIWKKNNTTPANLKDS